MHPDAQQETRDRGARGLTRQRALSKKEIDRINRMFQDLQDMRKHDRASVVDHTQQKTSKMHPDAQQATRDRGARGLTRQRAISKKEIDRINRMFQDLQDMRMHDHASVVDHTQQKTSKMHPDAQQATQDRGARGLTRQRALSKKKEAFAQSHFMLGFIRTKTFALRLILRRPH